MSLTTILGFLFGVFLFVGSILLTTNNYMVFLEGAGFIMVVGGTLAAAFVSYEAPYVIQALKLTVSIFFDHKVGRGMLTNEVGRIVRWGYIVQRSGLQGLESDTRALREQDRFVAFGVELVTAGYTAQEVREIMSNMVDTTFQRNVTPVEVLRNMGGNAPAFGMIATLVGLVIMLDTMAGDPSKIGPGMAVGLLGTLYGVSTARLILLPTASKVQHREEIVRFRNFLVAEGLALLAERRNPHYIQDRLNSFLEPGLHFDIDKMLGAGK